MKAFLSHSSADKEFVTAVYSALAPDSAWIDHAEIEWGQSFLEKIEEGIRTASDFVIFWSESSAKSEWVRLEVNMAFIELINRRAIRLLIVKLDETDLPLHLAAFHHISVARSTEPIKDVIRELRSALSQPTQGVRHRFVNRNTELDRIEHMINDPNTKVIVLHGFQGIGKGALAAEALRRFFEGAVVVDIPVTPGTSATELALRLHHVAFGKVLPELHGLEALAAIEEAMGSIASQGRFIVFRNGHHWLDNDRELEEPLLTVVRQALEDHSSSRNPVFLTSTRFPRIPPGMSQHVSVLRVEGLPDEHMASLLSLWFELSNGSPLVPRDARRVAPELHGHPVAAKIASNLIVQFGTDYLLDFPKELMRLRRDLAKNLINSLSLSESACDLMEVLAIIGVPVPSRVIVESLEVDEDSFQEAVAAATAAGIAETTDAGHLRIHPLVSDYFWRSHLDHEDYRERAGSAASAVHKFFDSTTTDAGNFIPLMQAVFRLYAVSGDLTMARNIRNDLIGELSQAAITHYNRRQLELSETYIQEVLSADPTNWRMRQYLARIRVRQSRWRDADNLIDELLAERSRDIGLRHLRGWKLLREGRYNESLSVLTAILAERDHVATFRDAADALYRLNRVTEALDLLQKSKQVESDNPYTLDLEARIYEEAGEYDLALTAANVAVNRDPGSWGLRHRRARILSALDRRAEALEDATEAVRIDPEQFVARSTLVSLLLDTGDHEAAATHIDRLLNRAANQMQRQIAAHLHARSLYLAGELARSLEIVNGQIKRGVNLAPSYGLLVQIRLAEYEQKPNPSMPSARLLLEQAKVALTSCEAQDDHNPGIVRELRDRIEALESWAAEI